MRQAHPGSTTRLHHHNMREAQRHFPALSFSVSRRKNPLLLFRKQIIFRKYLPGHRPPFER
jgi:hypothetical protein